MRGRSSAGSIRERRRRAGSDVPTSACTDRKSTRLNSSHLVISYAVFCLKKKTTTHNERVISLHSLLDADFYREGARITPTPRRRVNRRGRRKLTLAPFLVPVTPDVQRRL